MAGENEQIVRPFFDRQPEDKLSMTLGAGEIADTPLNFA